MTTLPDPESLARAATESLGRAPPSRIARLVFFAAIAVGAAIRFAGLTRDGFWLDEGWVLDIVERATPADVVRASSLEVHPPLSYLLLWGWAQAFGTSDAALRAFYACVGTAAIPAAFALARRLVSPRAALVATAIVALSPLLVRHSQDIKQYALLLLLATVSTERCLAYAQGRSNRPLVGWAVATTLLLYTHFIGVTAVLAQDVVLLLGAPRGRRRGRDLFVPLIPAHLFVVVAVAPWLPFLFGAGATFQGFPGSESLRSLWRALVSVAGSQKGTAVLFGLAAGGLLLARRRGRAFPRGLLAALILGTMPYVLPWVVSALTFPSFATRITIHAVPPLAAALGAGLVRLSRRPSRGLAIGLAAAVVAIGLARIHPRVEKEQWREAAAFVASEARPGDAVLSLGRPDGILLRRYLPRGAPVVVDARAGIPAPSPTVARLFVLPSVHTKRLPALRASLLSRGWKEQAETPFVMVRVLRFVP